MKLAIMQPYFVPYIGYFQLINSVDQFIIYDDIEYTKKGWINRNRILQGIEGSYISLPLKKDSDYLDVKERFLAESWVKDRKKILNRILSNYNKAPYFNEIMQLVTQILLFEDANLFNFLHNSLKLILAHLEIETPMTLSSSLSVDKTLKSECKVIDICRKSKATAYVNPIGGVALYQHENFEYHNIKLHFLKTKSMNYPQFSNDFVSSLSIIDVLMFNSRNNVTKLLLNYELL